MRAANCDACHADATDGDVQGRPTRAACGTCHDGIDFTEKNSRAADYHRGGAMTDDSLCDVCHSGSIGWPTREAHGDPRDDTTFDKGLNVEVVSATNQAGATSFSAGDTVTVTYKVTYDDGTAAPSSLWSWSANASTCGTVSGGGSAVLAGPTDHLSQILVSADPGASGTTGSLAGSSSYDAGTGLYSYTFATSAGAASAIPSTIPDQPNESADLGVDDWTGKALPAGTYRLTVSVYTTLWYDPTDTCEAWKTAASGSLDVLYGGATTVEPRAIVDESLCDDCHGTLEYHDASAKGLDACLSCHTAGAEDTSGSGTSVDMPRLIHTLHNASDDPYCVDGTSGSTCFTLTFPRFDGGMLACAACHSDDSWKQASHRGCVTCHDSTDAEAHAATNTDDTWGEACDACHGDDRLYAVDTLHAWAE
jgi:hypothetical protein